MDAMVRAPSAGNKQNRNYYVISNPETLNQLENALAAYYKNKLKPGERTLAALEL